METVYKVGKEWINVALERSRLMWFSAAESKLDVRTQSCGHSEHRHTTMGCGPQQLEHKVPLGSSCSAAGAGLALSSLRSQAHSCSERVLAVRVADRHTKFGHSTGAKEIGVVARSSLFSFHLQPLCIDTKNKSITRLFFRQRNLTCP